MLLRAGCDAATNLPTGARGNRDDMAAHARRAAAKRSARFWSNKPLLSMHGLTLVVGTLVIWAGMVCLMRA